MNVSKSFPNHQKNRIDLRTGQPYANLIDSHRLFASTMADYFGVDSDHVLPTSGATGAIEAVRNHIFRIALKPKPLLLTVSPGYWRARESFEGFGFTVADIKTEPSGFEINEEIFVRKALAIQPDAVYLSLPNNPTGAIFDPASIMSGIPDVTTVIFDFTLPGGHLNTRDLIRQLYRTFRGRKLFLIGSTSKSHNTAEYRIGWAIAARSEDADELHQENRNVVSCVAVQAASRALNNEDTGVHRSIAKSIQLLKSAEATAEFELMKPVRSVESSYALIRLRGDSGILRHSLEHHGISVMWGAEFGLTNEYVRVETSQPDSVETFIGVLAACLASRQSA